MTQPYKEAFNLKKYMIYRPLSYLLRFLDFSRDLKG